MPSGCLVGKALEGHGTVYCVRGGRAVLVPVHIGIENGIRVVKRPMYKRAK